MNKSAFHMAAAAGLIAAFSLASAATAQNVNPSAGSDQLSSDQLSRDSDAAPGTIQWGPPQQEQPVAGAQGPVRSDTGLASDPSIRDSDPLTQNGPWEQLSGDRIVNHALQQQEVSQPSQQQPQSQ